MPRNNSNAPLISARELEEQIASVEGFHVILLCSKRTKFAPYPYKKAFPNNQNLHKFRTQRLLPIIENTEHMIFKSLEHAVDNGRWLIKNIRED